MNSVLKTFALLLAALMLFTLFSCSLESGSVSGTDDHLSPKEGDRYLGKYGDFEAAKKWIKNNITGSDIPPVSFTLGKKTSKELSWEKIAGTTETVTDYPDTEEPAQRIILDVAYLCRDEDLRVDVRFTFYPGFPIVEFDSYLSNLSDSATDVVGNLCSISSAVTDAGDGPYTLHYSQGSLGNDETDYMPHDVRIKSSMKFEISNGMPTSAYLPYFNVSFDAGGGVILAVNWQGNWFADFRPSGGAVLVRSGQNGLRSVMTAGERFRLPGTVLLFYRDGDWQEGQNIWRRWIIKHNLMRNTGRRDYKENIFVCSPVEGTDPDLNYISALSSSDIVKKYNCVYEIDAGWYGKANVSPSAWVNEVGNWYPSDIYGDGGLKKISDACHEAGMGFCLWFEPERVVSSSKAASILGDNVIYFDYLGRRIPYGDAGKASVGLVDYGSPEAREYVVKLISDAVREYGIDVYRQDFNTENQPFWAANDALEEESIGGKRSGATENHACEGYVTVLTEIEKNNPGLIFDICSGGGRRYDLESVRFGFQHTKSDYCIEVNSQQCQNFSDCSWNVFTGTGFSDPSSLYDVRSRLTLSIGVGAAVNETVSSALEEWNKFGKYLYGDYYRLGDYSLSGDAVISLEFCDSEHDEGMIAVYFRSGGEVSVPVKGLDPDSGYKLSNPDNPGSERYVSGRELTEKGIQLSAEGTEAAVIFFARQKGTDTSEK